MKRACACASACGSELHATIQHTYIPRRALTRSNRSRHLHLRLERVIALVSRAPSFLSFSSFSFLAFFSYFFFADEEICRLVASVRHMQPRMQRVSYPTSMLHFDSLPQIWKHINPIRTDLAENVAVFPVSIFHRQKAAKVR